MHPKTVAHMRKSYIEMGKIYFWTATINKWQHILETDDYRNVILGSLEHLSNAGRAGKGIHWSTQQQPKRKE